MAMAREPATGMRPRASPQPRRPVRLSAAVPKAATGPPDAARPKAATGPPDAARPKAISPMTPVEAISTTKIT